MKHPLAWSIVLALLLAACSEKKPERHNGQAAARVNQGEITIPQINLILQQQPRALRPEVADAAGRQVLEKLIDQELAAQKAEELKLDREPRVVQMMEAARREVLARAYAEKTGEAVARPTADEVHRFFEDKPALFKERRLYSIQEIAIEARPEQLPALRDKLTGGGSVGDFLEYLRTSEIRYSGTHAVRAAEQLPAASLEALARLRDGQGTMVPTPTGATVVVLVGTRSQPLAEEQARPLIEQYLLAERRRKLIDDEVKALRGAARIEYVGRFAEAGKGAAAAASGAEPAASAAGGTGEAPK